MERWQRLRGSAIKRPTSPQGLLLLEPQTGFTGGLPAVERKKEPITDGPPAVQAINEAIAEARHNPETARSRFALVASDGRRDPKSLERRRATFAKEGIPSEFLSHYQLD